MDNHHGNSFAKTFLSEDGMAEVGSSRASAKPIPTHSLIPEKA